MIHLPITKASDRHFKINPNDAPVADLREELFQLEKEGELEVIRVPDNHVELMT